MKNTMLKIFQRAGIAGIFITLASCGGSDQPAAGGFAANAGAGIPAVDAVQAIIGTLPLEERLTGRAIARNQTEIYPEAAGTIVEIFVENGDVVQAGDPLLRLRDAEFAERYQQALSGLEIARAQTQQARASLELVKSQVSRTESLVQRNLENTVNLENVRSQLAIAQADLDLRLAQENQARSLADERLLQLQNATIRAPISGTVGQRGAEVGQLATTSTRLFVIGDLSQIRVELMLSDRMLEYIDVGVPVNIYSTAWESTVLNSTITRVSPFLDSSTMRTQAFVELDNEQNLLRPGMFVTVDVLYGESAESVVVPNSALYRDPRTGIEGVYVVSAEAAAEAANQGSAPQDPEGLGILSQPQPVRFVPVEQTASGRMATAVRGINAGEVVVTVGQNLLQSGATQARVRLLSWDSMMELQQLQSEDMLDIISRNRKALEDKS